MYATVNHMRFTSPVEAMVDVLREGAEVLGTYPGFQSMQIVQEGADGVVFIVLWQSQQEAESAAYSFGPGWLARRLVRDCTGRSGPVPARCWPASNP